MYYIGIDPGVRKLGYAVIDDQRGVHDAGILLQDTAKPTREDYFDKMSQIKIFFEKLFTNYQGKIISIGIEKLFFTKFNQANAEFVFGIRAVLILLAREQGIKVCEYSPIELKKRITGNGKAGKLLVQRSIERLFGLVDMPEFDDAADALGLAYLASKHA